MMPSVQVILHLLLVATTIWWLVVRNQQGYRRHYFIFLIPDFISIGFGVLPLTIVLCLVSWLVMTISLISTRKKSEWIQLRLQKEKISFIWAVAPFPSNQVLESHSCIFRLHDYSCSISSTHGNGCLHMILLVQNLSQLASINHDVLLQSGKDSSRCSSPYKYSSS